RVLFRSQVQGFELGLPDIGGDHPAVLGPADPVGIAEAPGINFFQRVSVLSIGIRIPGGYPIVAVLAIVAPWIEADDRSPNSFYTVGDEWESSTDTSSIPNAQVD